MEEEITLPEDRLWEAKEVGYFLGVPVQTLYCWHNAGKGPECGRVGRHLRYEPADVRAWWAAQKSMGVAA